MLKKSDSSLQSISHEINAIDISISSSPTTINKSFLSEIYYNPRLEGKITSIEPNSPVDFSYWNLIDQDLLIITKKILLNKQCSELYLCGNKITSQGALILTSKLSNNSTLKILDLSYNSITNDGVQALSQALLPNHNSSLKILSLNKNRISNDGAYYLSEMLETNQTLTKLSLSNNEISNDGVKQLAHVLTYQNKTLKVLELSFNVFITDLCIDYLIQMFEFNKTLRKLSINDCNLSETGKIKLRETTKRKINFEIVI